MTMTRKQFLATIGTAAGAAVLAACGGDDGGGGTADAGNRNCNMNGTNVNITGNHGHTLVVSKADVMAGTEKTYDISGTGGHTHMVTVTAAQFSMLQQNMNVSVTSTSASAHTHSISITCA